MMGPNCVRVVEELASNAPLAPGARALDLGCGRALTSIYLARRFGAKIFATDLWVEPTENLERVERFGLTEEVIPIHAEAHDLPYARGYFDAVFSVYAYHYFGAAPGYLERYLAPLVRPGGIIAVAIPGLQAEFDGEVPGELRPFWQDGMNFHTPAWWRSLWEDSGAVDVTLCGEMKCHADAWRDWLACDNEYARGDVAMMAADGGKYFNHVRIVAQVK